MFITFEGIDGAGKSTQMRLLGGLLMEKGYKAILTQEPRGSPFGVSAWELALHPSLSSTTTALVFMSAMAYNLESTILPSLKAGQVVLCDRWLDSTLAYQGYGAGCDIHWLEETARGALNGFRPQITFLMDIPVPLALDRIARRKQKQDRFEASSEYLQRVRDGYLELAATEPERFVVLDATQPIDVTQEQIWKSVNCKLLHAL